MKTDLYTKCVLTVIAVALSVIAFRNFSFIGKANAENITEKKFVSVPMNDDGSINVKIVSNDMDVNIKSIAGSSIYGSLPINIKEVSGSSISSYGLPVNVAAVGGSSVYGAIPVKDKN